VNGGPYWRKVEESEWGSLIFWALVLDSVLGRSYHRNYIKAVVGWGDDSGAEFPFFRERSERSWSLPIF
jgi:hypothetical protein